MDKMRERSLETIMSQRDTSPKKKEKCEKQKLLEDINLDIPGVRKVVLSEESQKFLNCVIGENIIPENPSIYIAKNLIQSHLELKNRTSEFLPFKEEVDNFSRLEILLGFVFEEIKDSDEFYICLSEEATDTISEITKRIQRERHKRLMNLIHRPIKPWLPRGSEEEVNSNIIKNNRPLIEVELVTRYPIRMNKIQFRIRNTADRNDGYMELVSMDEKIINVCKRKIDVGIQTAPIVAATEAQTYCRYPTNKVAQYLYDVREEESLKFNQHIKDYFDEFATSLSDYLVTNSSINLYSNDYDNLIPTGSSKSKKSYSHDTKTVFNFMEVNLSKNKVVTSISWHPKWSDVFAVAYAKSYINNYNIGEISIDNVFNEFYDIFPVLIWSFNDIIKPKLILDAPSEVFALAFCVHDDNLLVGGCKNGQIVIWDIRNSLQATEKQELLTTKQQEYQDYIQSLVYSTRVCDTIPIERPTATSNLRYSHKEIVTDIQWISPYYKCSKYGHLSEIPEYEEILSKQLLTCSLDGTVFIWDLMVGNNTKSANISPRLDQLKGLSSMQKIEKSPYKQLHSNIERIYQIILSNPLTSNLLSLSKICSIPFKVTYEEIRRFKGHFGNVFSSVHYKPIIGKPEELLEQTLSLSTMEGDYIRIKWDGQHVDLDEEITPEKAKIIDLGKYHDGPITSISKSETNIILTVGGKIVALWRDDFEGKPVLWRKNISIYTTGNWNKSQTARFKLGCRNGSAQIWAVFKNSKNKLLTENVTTGAITVMETNRLVDEAKLVGIGNDRGVFEIMQVSSNLNINNEAENKTLINFIDKEIQRKINFQKWQENWNARYAPKPGKTFKDQQKHVKIWKTHTRMKLLSPEQKYKKMRYTEKMKEKFLIEQEEKVREMALKKKVTDPEELKRLRQPLMDKLEEQSKRKEKQKEKQANKDVILSDSIGGLFPEVTKEKPAPIPDPYVATTVNEENVKCYNRYVEVWEKSVCYVVENRYEKEFNWKLILNSEKRIRENLNVLMNIPHRRRHEMNKLNRKSKHFGVIQDTIP